MLAIDDTTFPVQTASQGCPSKGCCQDMLVPTSPSVQFEVPTPSATMLPPSRIYWGTSDGRLWQYEVEIPSCLGGDDDEDQVLVRVRPLYKTEGSSRNNPKRTELATCLIGCRLVEFSKEGMMMGLRGSVWTDVLVCPSSTWVSPCRLPLSFLTVDLHQPQPRLGLCITLAFSDVSCADRMEILSPIQVPLFD